MESNREGFMKIIQEFKAFALRGNVIDLAVGVIIGAAFGKIVESLTSKILMPILTPIMGTAGDFEKLAWKFNLPSGAHQEVSIQYGAFINAVVQFLILAFCVFLLVKGMTRLIKKKDVPAEPSNQEKLLMEIRDLLKNRPA
jgi:large conductance mechanosensitive channel